MVLFNNVIPLKLWLDFATPLVMDKSGKYYSEIRELNWTAKATSPTPDFWTRLPKYTVDTLAKIISATRLLPSP